MAGLFEKNNNFKKFLENEIIVGIDLGTTNSCVGTWHNASVKIIANSDGFYEYHCVKKWKILGTYITPSCVSYSKNGYIVGGPAKKQLVSNPENTIYGQWLRTLHISGSRSKKMQISMLVDNRYPMKLYVYQNKFINKPDKDQTKKLYRVLGSHLIQNVLENFLTPMKPTKHILI